MKRAGQLRFQVTIQQPTITQSYGEPTETWSKFATAMADIEPLSGREYFAAKQIMSEQMFKITIRYIAGITKKMRVSYGGDYYDIQDINDVKTRHRELQLMCRLTS